MKEKQYFERVKKAMEYGSKGQWDECITYYLSAFEIMIYIDDFLDLAMAFLESGRLQEAFKTIEAVVVNDPERYKGYLYKGMCYENIGDNEKALEQYELALEKVLCDTTKEKFIDQQIGEVYFRLARMQEMITQSDEENISNDTIENMMIALEYDPNHFQANLTLGYMYEQKNDLEKAIYYTERAKQSDPKRQMAAFNLGVMYEKVSNFEQAKKNYLEEITKEGFYPYAFYNLALVYKNVDCDYQKAKEYYIKGLEFLSKTSSVWYNLGCCHVLTKNYQDAKDCFYCAIVLDDNLRNFILEDEEVSEFCVSNEYQELLLKLNK